MELISDKTPRGNGLLSKFVDDENTIKHHLIKARSGSNWLMIISLCGHMQKTCGEYNLSASLLANIGEGIRG